MQIIKFDETIVSKSKSMQDFYERIGIWDSCAEEHADVCRFWMNLSQNEELGKALKRNARKNKELKGLTQIFLDQVSSLDWLNYSPIGDELILRNELWILTPQEADDRRTSFAQRYGS